MPSVPPLEASQSLSLEQTQCEPFFKLSHSRRYQTRKALASITDAV